MRHDPRRSTVLRMIGLAAVVAMAATGCLRADVTTLAGDAFGGRQTGTAGGDQARTWVANRLASIAQPIRPDQTGIDGFLQPLSSGGNVLGIIPGTDLADEYVLIGAHFDHLGTTCAGTESPRICNGATDNATGTAAVLALAEHVAAHPGRRSLIVALWDDEEAGHLGSKYYVAHPLIPLSKTVATVTFDILGANIGPTGTNETFLLGGTTGGPVLAGQVAAATAASSLDELTLSPFLGGYRSDYAEFLPAQIPTLFFSDSTGPCYHTADDEVDIVDWGKLDRQVALATDLVDQMLDGDRPTWTAPALVTWSDLLQISASINNSASAWGRYPAADQTTLAQIRDDLNGMVAAGEAAFTGATSSRFITDVRTVITIFTHGTCEGFVPAGS